MSSIPLNPFKDIRLRANLSQYEVARRSGVTKHAVLRLEQGMYADPLPTLVDYFVSNYPITQSQLLQDYEDFQVATRESNTRLLGDFDDLEIACPVGEHPLTYLRERMGYNPTQLAKMLCLSQTVISYFEKRSIHQHSVPEQLINALHDADYTEQETKVLENCYETYRLRLVKTQDVRLVNSTPVGSSNVA